MAPTMALNAFDRSLRKLMNNNFPFGGKVIVLGKYKYLFNWRYDP
jgi:hypothetical protein